MSTPPSDDWESRLDYPGELRWAWEVLADLKGDELCVDNYRVARAWVSSQRRRYRRMRDSYGCCGYADHIVKRWNWRKLRWDIYMIGFNYGH